MKTDMGLTLVEKIAARHADGLAPGTAVRSGDFISIRPRHVMTHDNTGAVIPKFKQIGATTNRLIIVRRRYAYSNFPLEEPTNQHNKTTQTKETAV